jgi:hypothetical protein
MDRKAYLKAYLKDYRASVKCVNLVIPLADYRKLERAAKAEGVKPTRLLVEIGIANLDQAVYVPAAVAGEIKQLKFLIRNIANNLNQIAHHTNTIKRAADAGAVFAELKRLERCIDDYTRGRLKAPHDHQVHEP